MRASVEDKKHRLRHSRIHTTHVHTAHSAISTSSDTCAHQRQFEIAMNTTHRWSSVASGLPLVCLASLLLGETRLDSLDERITQLVRSRLVSIPDPNVLGLDHLSDIVEACSCVPAISGIAVVLQDSLIFDRLENNGIKDVTKLVVGFIAIQDLAIKDVFPPVNQPGPGSTDLPLS